MEKVADFFGGNPFATLVGQRIEQATDASLPNEDWAANIEICDLINELDEGPKDAARAIKKRLQLNAGKNNIVVMYTLTVLETCVKNCGRRFHTLVCSKDYIQELVKLIGPKNDPPAELQEKVLTMIQCWADAFQPHPELHGVVSVYQELKSKGIEFPMTNLDTMAPIITPQRTHASLAAATGTFRASSAPPLPAVVQRPNAPLPTRVAAVPDSATEIAQPIDLSEAQLTKLTRELGIVEGNMSVLSEMLAELVPGQENPADLELLRELYATCRAMQSRLVELVGRVANDQLTDHLLKLNDDLNNLFLRYERYERNRQAVSNDQSRDIAPAASRLPAPPSETPALIDLSDETLSHSSASAAAAALPSITANMQGLGLDNGGAEKDFDMFAHSRNVTYQSSKPNANPYAYGDPDQVDASLGKVTQQRQQDGGLCEHDVLQGAKEEDMAEMEAWLEKNPMDEDATLTPAMKDYLKKRSASDAASTSGQNPHPSASPRRPDTDSSLFSL